MSASWSYADVRLRVDSSTGHELDDVLLSLEENHLNFFWITFLELSLQISTSVLVLAENKDATSIVFQGNVRKARRICKATSLLVIIISNKETNLTFTVLQTSLVHDSRLAILDTPKAGVVLICPEHPLRLVTLNLGIHGQWIGHLGHSIRLHAIWLVRIWIALGWGHGARETACTGGG